MAADLTDELRARIACHLNPQTRRGLLALSRLCRVSKAWCKAAQPRFWSAVVVYDLRCPAWTISSWRKPHQRTHIKKGMEEALEKRRGRPVAGDHSGDHVAAVLEESKLCTALRDTGDFDANDWLLEWSAADLINSSTDQQLQILDGAPHLARLVKTVVFNGRYEGRAAGRAIERILKTCPALDEIVLSHPSDATDAFRRPMRHRCEFELVHRPASEMPFDAWPSLLRLAPSIRSLRLHNFLVSNVNTLFEHLSSSFPHLEHLSFGIQHTQNENENEWWSGWAYHGRSKRVRPSLVPTFRLRTLEIASFVDQELFDQLVNPHTSTLTSLTFTVRRRQLVLPPLPKLTHLAVIYANSRTLADTLMSAPPGLPHLELRRSEWLKQYDFQYQFEDHNISFIEDDGADTDAGGVGWYKRDPEFRYMQWRADNHSEYLFAHLPQSLTRLSLSFFPSVPESEEEFLPDKYVDSTKDDWACLVDSLKQRSKRGKNGVPTWLPNLRILDVADSYRSFEESTHHTRRQDRLRREHEERRVESGRAVDKYPKFVQEGIPWEYKKATTRRKKVALECEKRGVWLSGRWKSWEKGQEYRSAVAMRSC
ncbi:hypothetical protein JCM8097_002305 [Rhodosporidiobolus ruineniae]